MKRRERLWGYCSYCGEYSLAGKMVQNDVCPKCKTDGCMSGYVTTAEKNRGVTTEEDKT